MQSQGSVCTHSRVCTVHVVYMITTILFRVQLVVFCNGTEHHILMYACTRCCTRTRIERNLLFFIVVVVV